MGTALIAKRMLRNYYRVTATCPKLLNFTSLWIYLHIIQAARYEVECASVNELTITSNSYIDIFINCNWVVTRWQ